MSIRAIVLVAVLAGAVNVAAQQRVYRWVDEDGVVHYSDQAVPGAEEIIIQTAPSRSQSARPPRNAPPLYERPPREEEPADDQPFSYESIAFSSPTAEQTLWNIGGTLSVEVNVTPSLRSGHRLRLYFDGEPQTITGTQATLQEVWRGTHNLQAEVVDSNGEMMIRSEPIRFYVQQTSILN